MDERPKTPTLQVGGPVPPTALYVSRQVETSLLAALSEGTPCLVLGPPGTGKSSLALRLQERLVARGVACASVSLAEVAGEDAGEWFLALARSLATRLSLPDPAAFWRREQELLPAQRWQRYLRVEVLGRLFGKVVLIIDSAETVVGHPFGAGELAAALRTTRDARGTDPTWARLSFCLLGTADVAELGLGDLGRTFVLSDFQPEEAAQLLPALGERDAELWLDAVLGLTSGHPGLTLRLCQALRDEERPAEPGPAEAASYVEELARRTLAGPGGWTAPILRAIERRFEKDQPQAGALLALYRRLLQQGRLPWQPEDPVQRALLASGLAIERGDGGEAALQPRCRLLTLLFDEAWIGRRESERLLAPRAQALRARPDDRSVLLRGDELTEALRWAEGREDVSAAERALLVASLEEARRDDDRRREEQQVQEELRRARERAAQRRVQLAALAAFAVLVVGLCGTITYLAWGRAVARRSEAAAERERMTMSMHLRGATEDLLREREGHRRTRAQLAEAQQALAAARAELDGVRRELGVREARLKEVGGRVESIFKKRIAVKGARPGADTGINNKVVESVMLGQAWPALRRCYPLQGPLPQRLRLELTVQPNGRVGEASHNAAEPARGCVQEALMGLRFPAFAGAHYVRVVYQLQPPRRR